MKNIKNYNAKKYMDNGLLKKSEYKKVEDGIYKTKGNIYVTSLSFIQEPKYGEGDSSKNISQYPLEDILDKYYCYISDFYEDLNSNESKECVLEFASGNLGDIKKLREIIGKHVYNLQISKNGKDIVELIIK